MNKMLRQVVGLLSARVELHTDGSVNVYDPDGQLICEISADQIDRLFLDRNLRYRLTDGKHELGSAWRKSAPLPGESVIRQNWGADFLQVIRMMKRSVAEQEVSPDVEFD